MAASKSRCILRLNTPFMALRHQPWPPATAVADRLDPAQIFEEEKTPYYSPDRFYAMRLGQTLNQRYQIVTKLGYGSSSTVWLAKDLHRWRWLQERFVAIKVNAISRHSGDGAAEKELSTFVSAMSVASIWLATAVPS
ncbi:hypothetical protein GE09DRAFT_289850 [Coniochaeta sp. 2T2.1]|nr:hypothetical protein GE09DRAFT_289850 [Coniochaeta sp. 2T2.1]